MQVYVLGLNHQTAPVAVREALAFGPDCLPAALTSLVREPGVGEAAILSTCNRTEIWFAGDAPQVVSDWLARFQNVALEAFSPSLYLHAGEAAVHHVFRVACGLDSMVLGETQILGQVKSAMREAQTVGTLGAILHRLFQSAFSAAKAVRSDTAVGANIVSMAAAAVHLCERIFEDIRGQRVLFIGAGEMISLCAAHFAAAAPQEIVVVNRTAARAQPLAERFGARALPLDSLSDILPQFDIVLSCTASPVPIIGLGLAERAIRERRHKPVVMIDLAVPRDIEPEIGRLDDVFLYCVDDLAQVVASGVESRAQAVAEAERILDNEVAAFMQWRVLRGAGVHTIRALRANSEALVRTELEKAKRQLAKTGNAHAALESLARALSNKMLHAPSHFLHQATPEENDCLRRAFGLQEEDAPEAREDEGATRVPPRKVAGGAA